MYIFASITLLISVADELCMLCYNYYEQQATTQIGCLSALLESDEISKHNAVLNKTKASADCSGVLFEINHHNMTGNWLDLYVLSCSVLLADDEGQTDSR